MRDAAQAAVKEMEELKEFAEEVGRSERWAHRKMVADAAGGGSPRAGLPIQERRTLKEQLCRQT